MSFATSGRHLLLVFTHFLRQKCTTFLIFSEALQSYFTKSYQRRSSFFVTSLCTLLRFIALHCYVVYPKLSMVYRKVFQTEVRYTPQGPSRGMGITNLREDIAPFGITGYMNATTAAQRRSYELELTNTVTTKGIVSSREIEKNHSAPFYDVPPQGAKKNLICDITSSIEEIKLDAASHKASPVVSIKKRKSFSFDRKQSMSCGCKVYIAVLSSVVLLGICAVSFFVIREQFFGEKERQEDKITELEQNITNMQMILDEMTKFFSKDCQYRKNTHCYSIHHATSVSRVAAAYKCQIHGKKAALAQLRTKNLQEVLSSSLKNGEQWWIDGYRSNQQFQFSDGSLIMVNKTDFEQSSGKCLSLAKRNENGRLEATDCSSSTNGFICQFPPY